MYTISKQYHFSASHILHGLPDDHPCSRLHGHNYEVEIELQSEVLDDTGFVMDYRRLDEFKTYIDEEIDHRHLNDVLGEHNTTAERMARYFYDWCKSRWPQVTAVRVRETPKTCAEFRP